MPPKLNEIDQRFPPQEVPVVGRINIDAGITVEPFEDHGADYVRRQQLRDIVRGFANGGFLAHRSP
jgi:hypothetical protein